MLGAWDVGRFEQRAGAMVRRVACELAAAELSRERRELRREREPLREREWVIDGDEVECHHLCQAAPIAAARDSERLARQRVAPRAMRRVDQLGGELAEQTRTQQAIGRPERGARLFVESDQCLVDEARRAGPGVDWAP